MNFESDEEEEEEKEKQLKFKVDENGFKFDKGWIEFKFEEIIQIKNDQIQEIEVSQTYELDHLKK